MTLLAKTAVALTCVVLLAACGPSATADDAEVTKPTTVMDLAWMSGIWRGPVGDSVLEENWSQPQAGTIGSLVRMSKAGNTGMVELILVEEDAEGLVFRLQQWGPGYVPLTPTPLTLRVTAWAERSVTFSAVAGGGLRQITYARPGPDTFTADVHLEEGTQFLVTMTAQ